MLFLTGQYHRVLWCKKVWCAKTVEVRYIFPCRIRSEVFEGLVRSIRSSKQQQNDSNARLFQTVDDASSVCLLWITSVGHVML